MNRRTRVQTNLARVTVATPVVPFFYRERRRQTPTAPVVVLKAHPVAWQEALKLAEGDTRRILVEPSGACVVLNKPRFGRA